MTTPTTWPGLGFDPAPGDPAGVNGLVTQLSTTARHLQETHDTLTELTRQQGAWTGEASTAFTETLDVLPRYLVDAHESLRRAGDVLGRWNGVLAGLQGRARDLEGRAVTARTGLVSAEEAERQARAHPDFGLIGRTFSAQDLPVAQSRIDAAQAGLDRAVTTTASLRTSLEDLLRRAGELGAEHADAARGAADGVRGADDGLAPPEPGWFDQAVGWVRENAGTIGDIAGVVSGVSSAWALIPTLTPIFGPIALISGGVALLAHGADVALNDKWDDPAAMAGLAADAFGVLPVVRVAGTMLDAGAVAARTSFETVPGVTSAVRAGFEGAGTVRGTAVADAVADTGDAGDAAQAVGDYLAGRIHSRWSGSGVSGDMIAKTAQGTADVGLQTPTINGLLTGEEYRSEKNVATGFTLTSEVSDLLVPRLVAAAAP